MKLVGRLAIVALLASGSALVVGDIASGSVRQKVRWTAIGDCVDLYDEEQTTYVFVEGQNCYFRVQVTPAKPARTVAIQYFDDDSSRWITEDEKKTNKRGVALLYPSTTTDEGYFIDGTWEYRLGVARLGSARAELSETFWIEFVPSD